MAGSNLIDSTVVVALDDISLNTGAHFDLSRAAEVVEDIHHAHSKGVRVVLFLSHSVFGCRYDGINIQTEVESGYMSVMALFRELFNQLGIPSVECRISSTDKSVESRRETISRSLKHYLLRGAVPIVWAAPDADNESLLPLLDFCSIAVAYSAGHDVYDVDPRTHPGARPTPYYAHGNFCGNATLVGSIIKALVGGSPPIVVVPLDEPVPLRRLLRGDIIGTTFDESIKEVESAAQRRSTKDRRSTVAKIDTDKTNLETAQRRHVERRITAAEAAQRVKDAMQDYPQSLHRAMMDGINDASACDAKPLVGFSLKIHRNALQIDDVIESSPAFFIGVRPGDNLISISGVPCQTVEEARTSVQEMCRVGFVTPILIQRSDERLLKPLWICTADEAFRGKSYFLDTKHAGKLRLRPR